MGLFLYEASIAVAPAMLSDVFQSMRTREATANNYLTTSICVMSVRVMSSAERLIRYSTKDAAASLRPSFDFLSLRVDCVGPLSRRQWALGAGRPVRYIVRAVEPGTGTIRAETRPRTALPLQLTNSGTKELASQVPKLLTAAKE